MKLPYFKIKEAFEEAKDSFSYGSGTDKISSAAKLFGKTVANVGMLAVEVGAEAIKKLPEETGKNAKKLLDNRIDLFEEVLASKLNISQALKKMLEDVPTPSTEDASAIARLMKRLTLEEQKFLIDTLRRYQAMQRKQQKEFHLLS